MEITVRQRWLLKLLGFEIADGARPYVSMHHSYWMRAAWVRLTGQIKRFR